jgi:hypothetical protein
VADNDFFVAQITQKVKGKQMVTTTEMDPFVFGRLYGDEKYSLNNMELKSAFFPAQAKDYHSIYSDRANDEWYKAVEGITSIYNGDAFWAGVSEKDLLIFAQRMADALSFKHQVTGARITRFTDSRQYPCLLLEMTANGKGVRNTRRPKRSRMPYGYSPYGGVMGVFEDYGSDED